MATVVEKAASTEQRASLREDLASGSHEIRDGGPMITCGPGYGVVQRREIGHLSPHQVRRSHFCERAVTLDTLDGVAGVGSGSGLVSVELRHLGGALATPPAGAGARSHINAPCVLNAVGAAHDPAMYGATFAERPSDEQPLKERLEVPNS